VLLAGQINPSRFVATKVLFQAISCGTITLHEKRVHKQPHQRDRLESGSAEASANREAHYRFANGFDASLVGHRHVHGQGQVEASIPLMLSHSLAIGYHGCDRNLAGRIVAGETELKPSENAWDWLGHGIYLWEDSPARALRWAEAEAGRAASKINSPAVLGAVVDLGNCLNLADTEALSLVKNAHQTYLEACAASGFSPAENHGADLQIRRLDCAVIETLHHLRQKEGEEPFDTARGFFLEGRPLYPAAGFRELDHVQICVRSSKQIIGYFLPRGNV
jgi:hypothetical protein